MNGVRGLLVLLPALALQGCMSSTLVLRVMADGHGEARITARVFAPGIRAFDSLFPERLSEAPKLEDLLPAPGEGELQGSFGTRVRLVSSSIEPAADGGTRTTVVAFDDVTQLRLSFPPVFSVPAGSTFSLAGLGDEPVISFAFKPHENGDRLLIVKLPDQRLPADPDPAITTFASDSAEELALKRAIKGLALRFFVEIEQPLLRTNAPAYAGSRATILDLDLDKMINAMDETKVRRMLSPGSLQEMLWQVGDLPGAVIPVEHEVFLEYQSPQAPPPPVTAAPPVAQGPPDTEIYLAPLTRVNGVLQAGAAVNITNNPGYDNQPFFSPDGAGLLFTSTRGAPASAPAATDIYRYDLATKQIAQITKTPESEYSPTVTPDGHLSVIRVELDGQDTQRLWQFTADGRDPRPVLERVKPVGYHAWADAQTLALYVLGSGPGQPATLQLADTRTGTATILASDIGRSLQRIPASGNISFVQRERSGDAVTLVIKQLDPRTRAISVLTPAVTGATEADCAWTPDGTLLMVKGGSLYGWRRGDSAWTEVAPLERLSLRTANRLAISPKGDFLALVGPPGQGR